MTLRTPAAAVAAACLAVATTALPASATMVVSATQDLQLRYESIAPGLAASYDETLTWSARSAGTGTAGTGDGTVRDGLSSLSVSAAVGGRSGLPVDFGEAEMLLVRTIRLENTLAWSLVYGFGIGWSIGVSAEGDLPGSVADDLVFGEIGRARASVSFLRRVTASDGTVSEATIYPSQTRTTVFGVDDTQAFPGGGLFNFASNVTVRPDEIVELVLTSSVGAVAYAAEGAPFPDPEAGEPASSVPLPPALALLGAGLAALLATSRTRS